MLNRGLDKQELLRVVDSVANEKSIDDCVHFFENRKIPLAINHCVSLYPSEDYELELNQMIGYCKFKNWFVKNSVRLLKY